MGPLLGGPFQELDPSGGTAQLFGGKHTLATLVHTKKGTIPLQKSISKEVLNLLLLSSCKGLTCWGYILCTVEGAVTYVHTYYVTDKYIPYIA